MSSGPAFMLVPPLRLWPSAIATVAKTYRASGLALRAQHEFRRRTGRFLAAPRHTLASHAAAARLEVPRSWWGTDGVAAAAAADRVRNGEHFAYRWEWRKLPGAAAWHHHPAGNGSFGPDVLWWRVPHLQPGLDIKDVWEPARFGWLYDLARYCVLGADAAERERLTHAARQLVADWWAHNPPFKGVHWSCGQEVAIRSLALLFTESVLFTEPSHVPEILSASGERIDDAIGYAISQRNNHGISEAAGLICLGVRLHGVHPQAERWLKRGRRTLERLVVEQFAPDGWYIQHSFNYARVALQMTTAAQVSLQTRGESLSAKALARVEAGVRLLARVMDWSTGALPNYGPNDGAYVIPLTTAPYDDFRPALLQAAEAFGFELDEDHAPIRVGESGWASIRAGRTQLFLRAGRYSSRPGHADALHIDVRSAGRAVVVDPGTVAYNALDPWRNPLVHAHFHNSPLADDQAPGIKGPRFLWWSWPEAVIEKTTQLENGEILVVATVPGRTRRTIRVTPDGGNVFVQDEAIAVDANTLAVRWLLDPAADPNCVMCTPAGATVQGRSDRPEGVYSPSYSVRIAAPSVRVVANANGNGRPSISTQIKIATTA